MSLLTEVFACSGSYTGTRGGAGRGSRRSHLSRGRGGKGRSAHTWGFTAVAGVAGVAGPDIQVYDGITTQLTRFVTQLTRDS